ncbi:MAG: hypothetical protein KDD44_10395, partial [Bdellovibrionales bacterium]|nr:hypothetical protein [Bdellovibrionales bacterium]
FAYLDLGRWNFAIGLGIAGAKATLIVLVFMEVIDAFETVRVLLMTFLIWCAIFIALLLVDYLTRTWPVNIAIPSLS